MNILNNTKSLEAWQKSKQFIPGGVNSPVRAYRSVGGNPIFIQRGKGAKLYDILERNNTLAFGEATLGFLLLTFYPEYAIAEFCDENGNIEQAYSKVKTLTHATDVLESLK